MKYVIAGPAGMGNQFGHFRENLLPEGRFAVVEDGEFANGGFGPSTVDGVAYCSRERAEAALEGRREE